MTPTFPGQYFPPGVFGCDEQREGFLAEWYSKHLKALDEPSLWALSRGDSRAMIYRFLWLRSFHRPVSVRLIVNPDLTGVVISKSTNGEGGYEPGVLTRNESSPVGKHGTSLFLVRLLQARFWELPSSREPGGPDGADWILEAVADGRYHIVDRWSPGEADPVHTLGMTLTSDLAGIRIDPREVY